MVAVEHTESQVRMNQDVSRVNYGMQGMDQFCIKGYVSNHTNMLQLYMQHCSEFQFPLKLHQQVNLFLQTETKKMIYIPTSFPKASFKKLYRKDLTFIAVC